MFPSLTASPNEGLEQLQGSQLLFSLRIKAVTDSVTSCVPASCVENHFPSLGSKDYPYKEYGSVILPEAKEDPPQYILGTQVT